MCIDKSQPEHPAFKSCRELPVLPVFFIIYVTNRRVLIKTYNGTRKMSDMSSALRRDVLDKYI